MKNEFVPYEEALALKELGFDEPCFGYYYLNSRLIEDKITQQSVTDISAPLYQQAFRWFRERGYVTFDRPKLDSIGVEPARLKFAIDIAECKYGGMTKMELMNTYEEAQDACLRKLIEIVNQNKDEDN